MRQLLTLLALATGCVGLASAASFSGTLLDASCYDQQKKVEACAATGSTTAFAISVSDKVYTLNDTGNTKAAEAMKNRADRSVDPNGTKDPNSAKDPSAKDPSAKDPSNTTSAQVTAKITGKLEGTTINVETIDVQ